MTPESKVKAQVNRVLSQFKGIYRYMPVPGGYGMVTLDYIVCFHGRFIGIETKAPGRKPTRLQEHTIDSMRRAGATVFVISDEAGLNALRRHLEELDATADAVP